MDNQCIFYDVGMYFKRFIVQLSVHVFENNMLRTVITIPRRRDLCDSGSGWDFSNFYFVLFFRAYSPKLKKYNTCDLTRSAFYRRAKTIIQPMFCCTPARNLPFIAGAIDAGTLQVYRNVTAVSSNTTRVTPHHCNNKSSHI